MADSLKLLVRILFDYTHFGSVQSGFAKCGSPSSTLLVEQSRLGALSSDIDADKIFFLLIYHVTCFP